MAGILEGDKALLGKWGTFSGINESESGVAEVMGKVEPTVAIAQTAE